MNALFIRHIQDRLHETDFMGLQGDHQPVIGVCVEDFFQIFIAPQRSAHIRFRDGADITVNPNPQLGICPDFTDVLSCQPAVSDDNHVLDIIPFFPEITQDGENGCPLDADKETGENPENENGQAGDIHLTENKKDGQQRERTNAVNQKDTNIIKANLF